MLFKAKYRASLVVNKLCGASESPPINRVVLRPGWRPPRLARGHRGHLGGTGGAGGVGGTGGQSMNRVLKAVTSRPNK